RQSRIYRVGPRAIDPKHDRSNRVPSASKARKNEATPNRSLSPTNHWQEPTRLGIQRHLAATEWRLLMIAALIILGVLALAGACLPTTPPCISNVRSPTRN